MQQALRRAALAAAVVAVVAAVVAGDTSAATAQQAQGASLLITPRQLSRELSDPTLVVLVVGPKETYPRGHIVGSRFVWFPDLALNDTIAPHALDLPDEADLRGRLEQLGISDRSKIVVVGDSDWVSPSTRVVWTLQAAGLGSRTRLLDGGMAAWKRDKLSVTTDAPAAPTRGHLTLPADRSIVVDHAWVQSHLRSPGIRIIDGRAPMFYEGVGMPEHNAKAGHIPGAKNIPFNSLNDDSLRFLPLEQLRQKFADAGVQPRDTVVAYCHVGQQATVVLFSARMLGHPIRLYDGSMNDWERRKLPLENPTAPKPPDGSRERP